MANTKVSKLIATTTPSSGDLAYVVDGGASRQTTLGNFSKGVVVTSLDITGLTASQLIRLNSGATALESSGKTVPTGDIVGTSDTQTLTNKTLTAPIISTISNTGTLTLPTSTDTLVGRATTDTLTNKTLTSPSITSPNITSGDLNLATGLNIQVNAADPKRAIYVPSFAMWPSTTAGCADIAKVESSSNKVNVQLLDFDGAGASKEFAEFGIQSPSYWDAGTVTVQFVWFATAGSGTVNWEIQGGSFADNDAIDAAYGTLQEVTDTLLATGDVHTTDETSAVTIAGSPTAGDWLMFRVARDPANDTNTSDARLMGIRIRFQIKQFDDQ